MTYQIQIERNSVLVYAHILKSIDPEMYARFINIRSIGRVFNRYMLQFSLEELTLYPVLLDALQLSNLELQALSKLSEAKILNWDARENFKERVFTENPTLNKEEWMISQQSLGSKGIILDVETNSLHSYQLLTSEISSDDLRYHYQVVKN